MSKKLQNIFDRVATHLLTQKKRAAIKRPEHTVFACRYRTQEGLSCAVGCLLSDRVAKKGDRLSATGAGGSVWDLANHGFLPKTLSDDDTLRLLSSLQIVHDGNKPSTWKTRLRKVAKEYELSDSVLKTL